MKRNEVAWGTREQGTQRIEALPGHFTEVVEGESWKLTLSEFGSKLTQSTVTDTDEALSNWRTIVLDEQPTSDIEDPSIHTDRATYSDEPEEQRCAQSTFNKDGVDSH